MFDKNYNMTRIACRILFIALGLIAVSGLTANAQTPSSTPAGDDTTFDGYKVTSSIEIGIRSVDVNGSENKYRSDLNYRNGVRLFDSSFSLDNTEGRRRFVDKLIVNASGWGADRSGFAFINAESAGLYKFNGNFRRISLFSDLNNHALNQHTSNTNRDLGDLDLTVYPMGDKFRLNFGASYNLQKGPGTWNARAYRDDFEVSVNNKTNAKDFRVGIEGNLLGFNLGLTQGYRAFNERSSYFLDGASIGNNQVDTTTYSSFLRQFPIDGSSYFTMFNAQRTFAKRVDFTARVIYSLTTTKSSMIEEIMGRDNNNNYVDLDRFEISGDTVRPQTRGDLGLTFFVTNNFKISNTFSFDKFGIDGGEFLFEQLIRRNSAGNPLATTLTRSTAYRVTDFRRYVNTIEGDYQIRDWVGIHLGYRYTSRRVELFGYSQTLSSNNSTPSFLGEEEENQTHTLIAGMKIKPAKFWVLFWDVEHGSADNVFTRTENYKFTNFRVRSRLTFDKVIFNFSGISKDNTNPSRSDILGVDFGAVIKSRIFAGNVDWNPIPEFAFSSGYTYTHQTSTAAIVINAPSQRQGISQFFVRDHYFFADVTARPHKRVSFYASYRINKDLGQGDRPLTDPYPVLIGNTTTPLLQPENIIASYPIDFRSPEFRVSFRLTKNVDWNVGYQYYDYSEKYQTLQDYRAHLPYTSLRIYFGSPDR